MARGWRPFYCRSTRPSTEECGSEMGSLSSELVLFDARSDVGEKGGSRPEAQFCLIIHCGLQANMLSCPVHQPLSDAGMWEMDILTWVSIH